MKTIQYNDVDGKDSDDNDNEHKTKLGHDDHVLEIMKTKMTMKMMINDH